MNVVKAVTDALKPVTRLFNNPYTATAISLFLVLYGSMARPALPNFIKNLFQNDIFRLFYVFLLAYIGDRNPQVALIVAVVFMVGMGLLADQQVSESFFQDEDDMDGEDEDDEEGFSDDGSEESFQLDVDDIPEPEGFQDDEDEDEDEDEDDMEEFQDEDDMDDEDDDEDEY